MTRSRIVGSSLVLLGAAFLATASCSAPSKGALVLAISTDMQTPKDISVVSVYVSTNGTPKFDYLGRVLPNGTVALPATVAVIEPDDPDARVRIRVTGFQEQTARVLRDVLTTVPHQQVSLLRLPLDFLDDGSAKGTLPMNFVPLGLGGNGGPDAAPEGDTAFDPTALGSKCDFDTTQKTSINGACVSAALDSSKLPVYTQTEVYGDGGLMPNGAPTSCFDVQTCFGQASSVANLDAQACAFPLPPGADPSTLNLALSTPATGACVASGGCYVPLVSDPTSGWTVQGTTVTMPAGVCAKLGSGVTLVSSEACPSELASQPPCEPTGEDAGATAVSPDASGSDAVDMSDASAPPETSTLDAGFDATVEAGQPDATTLPDAGPAEAGLCTPGQTLCDDGGIETCSATGQWGATTACSGGPAETCAEGGVCACPSNASDCAGQCIDTSSDISSCGSCGNACSPPPPPSTFKCALGGCLTTLVATTANGMAIDPTDLYFCDGPIMRVALVGGSPATVVSSTVNCAGMAVDASNVYWANSGTNQNDGSIVSAPIAGGTPTTLVAGLMQPLYVAVDAANVYWTDDNAGVVGQVAIGGGTMTTLASGRSVPGPLAVDGTSVYWTEYSGGTVMKVPLGGGTLTTLASAQSMPMGIAVDATTVYWANYGDGTVMKIPLTGGQATTLASGQPTPYFVAVDGAELYWGNEGPAGSNNLGSVAKVPVAGGVPAMIASGLGGPGPILFDATSVYWSDTGLMKLTPK